MVWGIYLFTPRHRVGVNVVVMDERQRVLLLKHVFHPQAPWGLPGGWLGRHEDPKIGVLRELREETGLTAVLENVLMVEHDLRPPHIGIVYQARVEQGALRLNKEILEAAWFSLTELPAPMTPGTIKALDLVTAVVGHDHSWREV